MSRSSWVGPQSHIVKCTMMSCASELISFWVRSAVLKANKTITNQKAVLEKILAPLAEEGIEISGIDLGTMKLDRESALALQREVRMMVMRGQHTTVDLDGVAIPLSPEEINKLLKEILIPYQKSGETK